MWRVEGSQISRHRQQDAPHINGGNTIQQAFYALDIELHIQQQELSGTRLALVILRITYNYAVSMEAVPLVHCPVADVRVLVTPVT
jgi:hypothetical protein